MKKIWLIVVGAVLTLATLAGILFGVKACNAKKNTKNGIQYTVQYLEKEYRSGESLVIRVRGYSDKELTAVKYTIDNGTETEFTVTKYKTSAADKKKGKGANCIDTGAEVIDLSKLTGNTHLMTIYIYEGENRTSLGTYTFKIVS